MNTYNISEAIIFLAKEYGSQNMPTSEETLRRAIRTGKLKVREAGDPGRKGYTISEKDLRDYAQERINRANARKAKTTTGASGRSAISAAEKVEEQPIPFYELLTRYAQEEMTAEVYYKEMFRERTMWENRMHEKKLAQARLNAQMVELQNDIDSCRSAIEAYADAIEKFRS